MSFNILPANPTFNTLLGQALGQAVPGFADSFIQARGQKAQQQGVSDLLQQILGPEASPEMLKSIAGAGLTGKDILANADKLGALGKASPQDESKQAAQNVFNEMAGLLKENAPGIGISPATKLGLSRKGVENRAYFDTLRARIEGALLPLVNKGALSKPRFDFILSNIPKASDSQRAILGKLKAIAKDLSLDESVLSDINYDKAEQKIPKSSFSKPSQGHVIMKSPDGNFIEVPRDQAKKLEKAGAEFIR